MLAIRVEAIQPLAEFNVRIEDYFARLTSVPLAQGHERVFFPGEMENRAAEENTRLGGVLLPADTIADLRRVAAEAGLAHAWPF
jgi:LDH2 family malate/lactate/ureidoglycolate dehydrogenase